MKKINVEKLEEYGFPRKVVDILLDRGIKELNPIQSLAIEKGLLENRNIVATAPTASGKTLIGELALIRHILRREIGVYLVPLRALASEKYEEFKIWEKLGLRIGISTGDYESPGEYLGRYDIIVATYERFDSLLRLNPSWIKRIGCVVVDELHLIGDPERGPVLEMILARLLEDDIQIVGLSATIGNPHELAEWLRAELVDLPWRPVGLIEGVYDRRTKTIVFYHNGVREGVRHRLGHPALSIALQSIERGMQVLVFVNNRRKTEEWALSLADHMKLLAHMIDRGRMGELIEMLKDSPSRNERETLSYLIRHGVAYHHAGLSSVARRVVEKGFRDRVIRAVFATPTLAAGVNLPARRVLVFTKRYDPRSRRMRGIPVFEYKQMAGRAGRPQYDPYGEAVIYDASSLNEGLKYVRGRLEPVISALGSDRSLRIHVLSLIATGRANTIDEIIKVFSKTLFHRQYGSIHGLKYRLEDIIRSLAEWDMVTWSRGRLQATSLGRTTTVTYLDPLSVKIFRENLPVNGLPGVLWILHIITMTPDYRRSRPYIPFKLIEKYEWEARSLAEDGVIPEPDRLEEYEYYYVWLQGYVHAKMLSDWINELKEDDISEEYGVGPGDIYSARDTASWISGSLSHIAKTLGLHRLSRELEKLSMRLEYGVREDALQLVELEGIGRVRARTLINNGIRTLKDLAKTPREKLLKLPGFGPRIVDSIYDQLRSRGII